MGVVGAEAAYEAAGLAQARWRWSSSVRRVVIRVSRIYRDGKAVTAAVWTVNFSCGNDKVRRGDWVSGAKIVIFPGFDGVGVISIESVVAV